jgi:hypothetical protein
MRAIFNLLIVFFLTCCERHEKRVDVSPDIVEESPRTLADLNLPEAKLNDLALKITESYEHLRPFLQQDIPPKIFEETLRDIHLDFDKKRIAAGSKPGHWLNGATINQRGVGLLSVFNEQDPPANVTIDYHSYKSTDILISKRPIWDRINFAGTEYGRMFDSEIKLTAFKNGISDLRISFMIIITREARQETAELEYQSGDHLYQLRGFYSMMPGLPESDGSHTWLARYDPTEKVVRVDGLTRYTGSKILSRDVFCESGFDLSEEAKRYLLEIMDMVMVYYANTPEKSVFRKLLEKQPYQLYAERETR